MHKDGEATAFYVLASVFSDHCVGFGAFDVGLAGELGLLYGRDMNVILREIVQQLLKLAGHAVDV